jgi:hypothetical protein
VLVEDEVEQHVHLVAALVAEEAALLLRGQVGLGKQDRVAAAPVEEGAQVAQEGVRVLAAFGLGAGQLDHERGGVDPEAGQAKLQPVADDLADLVPDPRVGDVEVGHVGVEAVQEPLAGDLVVVPVGVLAVGEDDPRWAFGLLVGPDVEVAEGRALVGPGRLEPGMLVGGVVDDQVGDHPDAPLAGRPEEVDQVAEGAQARVDAVEVADVVAVVLVGGGVERHQPDAGHPEPGQVVDLAHEPGEVADAVTVPVGEQLDVQAVDDGVLPPQVEGGLVTHPLTPLLGPDVPTCPISAGMTLDPKASMNGCCCSA